MSQQHTPYRSFPTTSCCVEGSKKPLTAAVGWFDLKVILGQFRVSSCFFSVFRDWASYLISSNATNRPQTGSASALYRFMVGFRLDP